MPRVAPESSVNQPHLHAVGARRHAAAKPAPFGMLLDRTDSGPTAVLNPNSPPDAATGPKSGTPAAAPAGDTQANTGDPQPGKSPQSGRQDAGGQGTASVATQAADATADNNGGADGKDAKAPALGDHDGKSVMTDPVGTAPPVATTDGTAAPPLAPAQVAALPTVAPVPVTDVPAKEAAPDTTTRAAETVAPNGLPTAATLGEPSGDSARTGAEETDAPPGKTGLKTAERRSSGIATKPSAAPGNGTDSGANDAGAAASGDGQSHVQAQAQSGQNTSTIGKSGTLPAHPIRPVGQGAPQRPDETGLQAEMQAGGTAGKAADISHLTLLQQPLERAANVVMAAAPAAAGPILAVPIAGLALEIAARAQAGSSRFAIRLDPPELGRIDVRLDFDRDGRVTSRLLVEKPETLDLLRRDAPELARALQQAGLKTDDNGMQFTLRDQSFGGRNQSSGEDYPRSGAAKLVVPDPEMTSLDSVPGGYGRALRLGTGIDIRV